MVKTLYLLRHAKSNHDGPALADHERPLSKRGRRAAAAMGRYLADKRVTPDLVLCSTAVRAIETLARAKAEWPLAAPVDERHSLYLAAAETLLAEVRALDDDASSAMLVGHNPGLSDLAQALLPARSSLPVPFPTGTVAAISFDVKSWRGVAPGRGRLALLMTPRELEPA
jgi:phosphohistidine phosphatase